MSPLQTLTVVAVVAAVLQVACAGQSPPHTLEEAAHRMDMILNNTRSRENYIRCFMDRGICNKDATNIKRILSDALSTNCSNCTQIQRMGVEKFIHYLQTHQPETWVSLSDKYKGGKPGNDTGREKNHHHDDDDDDDDDDEGEGMRKEKKHHKKGKETHTGGVKNNTTSHKTGGGEKNDTTASTTDITIIF